MVQVPLGEIPEHELILRILAGDQSASTALVTRMAPVVCARIRRMVGGRGLGMHSLEDLVQETFLRLYRNDAHLLRSWDPIRGSLAALCSVVARSTVLAAFDTTARLPSSAPVELLDGLTARGGANQEERTVDRDRLRRLRACLERSLSPDTWLVYLGLYEDGLEPAVLAATYNRPRAWVDHRNRDIRLAAERCGAELDGGMSS